MMLAETSGLDWLTREMKETGRSQMAPLYRKELRFINKTEEVSKIADTWILMAWMTTVAQ